MLFLFGLGVAIGCSKEDTEDGNGQPADPNFTLFKNQTGNPAADALQAQYTSEFSDYKVNFYGTFNADGEPTDINTITYQKTNNDTIVNFVLNPVTKRLASSFITVNNVKSQYVTRYDYPEDNPGAVTVSMYNYDWIGMSSELLFTTNVEKDDNPLSEDRQHMGETGSNLAWNLGAVATGVAVAEIVSLGGGFSGVAVAAGLIGSVLTSAVAITIITGVGIGVVILAISAIINKASASEINPRDLQYPPNTKVDNPSKDNDPTQHLPAPDCRNTRIKFVASMDAEGSIMLTGVQGGQGPYKYIVDKTVQDSQVFSGNYPDGSHLVGVVDANGCMGIKVVPLSRDMPVAKTGWFSGHYTLDGPDFPQHGQSGEVYVYAFDYYGNSSENMGLMYVFYVKSIVEGMPNFYYRYFTGASDFSSVLWVSDFSENFMMQFYLTVQNHGSYMTDYLAPGGQSVLKRPSGANQFYYNLSFNASFSPNTPSALTQANIDQINAIVASYDLENPAPTMIIEE